MFVSEPSDFQRRLQAADYPASAAEAVRFNAVSAKQRYDLPTKGNNTAAPTMPSCDTPGTGPSSAYQLDRMVTVADGHPG
jgi:hypothetical protein